MVLLFLLLLSIGAAENAKGYHNPLYQTSALSQSQTIPIVQRGSGGGGAAGSAAAAFASDESEGLSSSFSPSMSPSSGLLGKLGIPAPTLGDVYPVCPALGEVLVSGPEGLMCMFVCLCWCLYCVRLSLSTRPTQVTIVQPYFIRSRAAY